MRSSRGLARAVLATMLLLVVAGVTASTILQARAATPVPPFDHIFVVLEENHDYADIIGNAQAPYINGLASQNGLALQYSAVSHPSLPNYLALSGGSTFGITTDCGPLSCPVNAPNIADQIEGAGKTWKAYMDAMPSACATADSGTYGVRHDPFLYYNDIRTDAARCSSHVVPYPNLATDLASASTTPNYVWITPDVCNDMHDCAISVGDTWLQNNLPAIFSSPAWTTQRSLLLLTWDEGSTNHVATLAIGPSVFPGYQSSAAYSHYSLLKTVESAWNLAPLTTNDANASPMSDFFNGAVSGTVTSSTGGAIPNATVTDSTSNTSTTTNAAGGYTLSNLAPGSHSLTASAAGYTTSGVQTVSVTAGQTTTTPASSFSLTPIPTTGAVSGTVTSSAGGSAIPSATVTDSVSNTSTTTDAQGSYTLSGLAAGGHSLTASASGFTTSAAQPASVTAGQTTTGISFGLTPTPTTGAVSGTVTSSAGGAAIPSATVTDSVSTTSTTTDAQGSYTLSGLAAGSHTLTASASGFTTSQPQGATVTAGQTLTGVSFSLTPTVSSAPQLVQAAGANETAASTSLTANFAAPTVAGHLLVLSASLYTGATSPITSVTDSGGNTWTRIGAYFVSGRYSDGEMWYTANAKAATSVVVHTTGTVVTAIAVQEFAGVGTTSPLDVSAGTSNTSTAASSGSVTPTASTDLVVGFVAGHKTAQSISVGAGYTAQAQQTSNTNGSASVSVATGYKVLTSASAQAFTGSFTSSMYWAAGIAAFKVSAGTSTTGAVSGTVTSSTGGAIPNATVTDSVSNTSTTTNGSGVYTLSGLAAGSHSLTASAAGFTTPLAQAVTVTAGQALTGVNFSLTPSATTGAVSGTVTSSAGGAIPSATVSDSTSNTSTTTDASGNYTLSSLAAGSNSLTASAAGFTTSQPLAVTVTAGQTLPGVSFILTPTPTTGAVSGTVTSSLGGAIPGGATVTDSTSNTSITTDASGNYTLSSLAAGSNSLTASAAGFTTSLAQVVTVTADQTLTGVSFILTPTASSAPKLVQATGANETAASTR